MLGRILIFDDPTKVSFYEQPVKLAALTLPEQVYLHFAY